MATPASDPRPAEASAFVAPLIASLLAGDAEPLRAALDELGKAWLDDIRRLWWELCTLYGEVVGVVEVEQDGVQWPDGLSFILPQMTGGAPRRLHAPDRLAAQWREALRVPPSRELHRLNALATLQSLRAERHAQPDSAFALLRHHTDRPVDFWHGRPLVGAGGGQSVGAIVGELHELGLELDSMEGFERLVVRGLSSHSLPRRDLCWRLSRLPAQARVL